MVGAEWAERQAVFQADRDFIVEGWNDPGTTTGAVAATYWSCGQACPSQAAIDAVFADVAAAGTVNPASDTLINPDGTVFKNAVPNPLLPQFTARGATSYTGPLAPTRKIMTFQNGVVGESNQDGYSSSPLERASLFGRAIYDLTDNVQAFVQGNFSQVEVDSVGPWTLAIVASAATIPHGTGIYAPSLAANGTTTLAAYLPGGAFGLNCPPTGGCTNSQAYPVPPELATLLDSRANPNATFQLQRYLNFMPSRATNNQTTVYQLQTGVEGSFPNRDWTWEAYVSHGRTTVDSYLIRRLGVGSAVQAGGAGAELRPRILARVGDRGAWLQHQMHDRVAARRGLHAVRGLHRGDGRAHEAVHALGADDRRGEPARRHRRHARGRPAVRRRCQQPREYGAVRAGSARRRAIHAR